MNRKPSSSRRQWLRGTGGSLLLPTLSSALPPPARAAAEHAVPSRMVVAHFGTGMNVREFFPDTDGPDCGLPRIVRPLEPVRRQMTILSGLQLEHGGGHTGDYSFLSGAPGWTASGIQGGVSFDQLVAQRIGVDTRYPSLQFSIERGTNFGNQGLATLSWSQSGIPMAAENDPHAIFQRLFGQDDNASRATAETRFRRRGSILDMVHEQAADMQRRLSVDDRRKLDEYFQSVRSVEEQLQRDVRWSSLPKPKPNLDGLGDYSSSLTPDAPGFDYARYQRLMYDLVVLALSTDSTRVITYNVRQELRGGVFETHGVSKGFHSLSHHNNDPKNLDELAKVDEINMQFWLGFLERMQSVTQSDGRSLLDHTAVAFSSGAGMDHSRDKLPTALFGGEALGLRHQTHLKLPEKTPLASVWHTMADRVGVPLERLQDSSGVITGLIT